MLYPFPTRLSSDLAVCMSVNPRGERDQVMTTAIDRRCLSPKRQLLCSRENALRVASRIFDHSQGKVSILRTTDRSEEHTSELQSLMRISYAVLCLKKKKELHSCVMLRLNLH